MSLLVAEVRFGEIQEGFPQDMLILKYPRLMVDVSERNACLSPVISFPVEITAEDLEIFSAALDEEI